MHHITISFLFFLNLTISGTANFNAFHGCLKCTVVGERQNDLHINVFPTTAAPKRTDLEFRNKAYGAHHQVYKVLENGKSKKVYVETPLLRLPLDIVEDVIVSDSLHLLHLGITKKLLSIYKDGQIHHKKWSPDTVIAIDKLLNTIKLPVEIHRQVRGLHYLSHWKASECGSFLNYIGIAILSEFIDKAQFENFTNLFCAVTICSNDCYKTYLPVAQLLFEDFVEKYAKHFKSVTSNQHNLVHVVDEVRRFGALHTISSYPFENHLFQIKNLVRSGRLPLNQIINRIAEKQRQGHDDQMDKCYPMLKYPCKDNNSIYLCIVLKEGLTLSNDFPNKWFLSSTKTVHAMVYASKDGIHGQKLKHVETHFKTPFQSMNLNVFRSKHDHIFESLRLHSLNDVFCKLVAISVPGKTVFIPLHHTLSAYKKQ